MMFLFLNFSGYPEKLWKVCYFLLLIIIFLVFPRDRKLFLTGSSQCVKPASVNLIRHKSRKIKKYSLVQDPVHSACFHPSGEVAAVGTRTPRWLAIDLGTRDTLAVFSDGNEQIECLEFSPSTHFCTTALLLVYSYLHSMVYRPLKLNAKHSFLAIRRWKPAGYRFQGQLHLCLRGHWKWQKI